MKDLSVKFDLADSEFFTALRLVAGALCSVAEKDVDAAEDFKVCVTESALILKNCGFSGADVTLRTDEGLVAEVEGRSADRLSEGENELSLSLISALVSSCKITKQGNAISKVVLKL